MFSRGRQRTEKHEKSMASYNAFAWDDALSMAELFVLKYNVKNAREQWRLVKQADIISIENSHFRMIGDFIQKTERQRPAHLNAIEKEQPGLQIMILILAIIGVVRAARVMDLRDRYRTILVPGRGHRLTTAAVYDFAIGVRNEHSYNWPDEVFDAINYSDDD